MSIAYENLGKAIDEAGKILEGAADGFVIIARAANEDGNKDSYRYKTHGASSEARGLIETVRTFMDEEDRKEYRETDQEHET